MFYTKSTLQDLAATDRLRPVLVRLDQGRLTCPAQNAADIIAALEAQGWHCRDVQDAASR